MLNQYFASLWCAGKLFPYEVMHAWLSSGRKSEDCFAKREFSYTLANDIYIRCDLLPKGRKLTDLYHESKLST